MHGVTLALSLEQALNEVSGSLAWSHLDKPVELRMSDGLGVWGSFSHCNFMEKNDVHVSLWVHPYT